MKVWKVHCQVRRRQRRDRFIDLSHRASGKQRVIELTGRGLLGEQHHARGFAVDAVNRCEVGDAQPVSQSHQQGLLQVLAGRRHRQEMRLVGDHQQLVLEQHFFLSRDWRFKRQTAVVEELAVRLVGVFWPHRLAIAVHHVTAAHPVPPLCFRDGGKADHQKIDQSSPVAGRQ